MERRFSFGKVDYTNCGQKRNLVLIDMRYVEEDGKKRFSVCGSIKNEARTDSLCCGQCLDTIAMFVDTPLFKEIYRLWKLYHLNDMHPECEHQAELGWRETAKKEVEIYHFCLNYEAYRKRIEIKDKVVAAAVAGESFLLPLDERNLLNSKFFLKTFSEELPQTIAPLYKLEKTERKMLGWLSEADHPEGILSKPCPVCGYKYGSAWKYFPIPEDDEKIILHLLKTGEVPA